MRTLSNQLQQLSHGKYGLVVDGYLALHFKPSVLRTQRDVPCAGLRRLEVQLAALWPLHIELFCLLAYEVHQHQQPFGIHVYGSPVCKQLVGIGCGGEDAARAHDDVVNNECAQQLQVGPLTFDVACHLVAHAVLLGYTRVQSLPSFEQRLAVGQRACQAPYGIMTWRTILWYGL